MTSLATQDGAGTVATKHVESADIVILGAGYGGLHVAQRLARLLKGERKAEQNGDGGSNDLLMGDVLRTHEQQVWFLAEHLVDTPLVRA
jgi:NADPH-dependent 2,4-dienoyl-CoA reductase/sulfur reductase-like enzyme